MRSYSQAIDSTLEIQNLIDLEEKLNLPSGWEFSTHELETAFTHSEDQITLISDELGNSYILIN